MTSLRRKSPSAAPRRRLSPGKRAAPGRTARRVDFGAPVEGFFAKQPAPLRAILEALRAEVEAAAPDAVGSIKWGMANYAVDGAMMCALTAHKAHVNLVLSGPSSAFVDPEGRLEGESANGRHLRLTALDQLPRTAVRRWLRAAAKLAREKR
jgi:hypothetical protein